MIQQTDAIVLHQLKYSETSIILTLYTRDFGRQSYIVNGIRSAKSKVKMGLLQPLFLLQIEAYHKPNREVQRLKEFKAAEVYRSIPLDIIKSTMAMFLSELLNKILQTEEPESGFFEFLFRSLQYFDTLEKGKANFHLWIMVKLLSYLGFQLENNHSTVNVFFDMKEGCFVPYRPSFPNTPDTEESKIISNLISLDISQIEKLNIDGVMRSRILSLLVEYYSVHFEGIGTIKSLEVLHDIFH